MLLLLCACACDSVGPACVDSQQTQGAYGQAQMYGVPPQQMYQNPYMQAQAQTQTQGQQVQGQLQGQGQAQAQGLHQQQSAAGQAGQYPAGTSAAVQATVYPYQAHPGYSAVSQLPQQGYPMQAGMQAGVQAAGITGMPQLGSAATMPQGMAPQGTAQQGMVPGMVPMQGMPMQQQPGMLYAMPQGLMAQGMAPQGMMMAPQQGQYAGTNGGYMPATGYAPTAYQQQTQQQPQQQGQQPAQQQGQPAQQYAQQYAPQYTQYQYYDAGQAQAGAYGAYGGAAAGKK